MRIELVSNAYLVMFDAFVNNAYYIEMTLTQPLKRGDLRDALVTYAQAQTCDGCIEAMSLRAAARDLGVSSGAVYRHFKDKDALLVSVVHLGMDDLKDRFHKLRPEGQVARSVSEAVQRMFSLGHIYTEFAHENPTLWRQMFGRIGMICREDHMKDPDSMNYTPLDVATESARDLYRLGVVPQEPSIDDIRFIWSAIHGAADLAQSGIRLDGHDLHKVASQTVERCLLAIGCPAEVVATNVTYQATIS